MRRVLAIVLFVAVIVPGCGEPTPPPPPPKVEPPPPTAQVLFDDNMPEVKQFLRPQMASNPGAIKSKMNELKRKLSPTSQENGPNALLKITNELKTELKAAHERAPTSDEWDNVFVKCHAVLALDPGYTRAARHLKQAESERMRPKISLTRFFEDLETNVVIVYLNVFLPRTNTTESVDVRVGDVFHGMRLERIIGQNTAIEVTYLETNRTYRIESK